MRLGAEGLHQHPAVVQTQTMNKTNHSKLKLRKGRAASALSPFSVTNKGTGTGPWWPSSVPGCRDCPYWHQAAVTQRGLGWLLAVFFLPDDLAGGYFSR